MPSFSIGLSALRTSQVALEVVSNNVSNADTEGYHRRRVTMETRRPNFLGGFRIGNGVSISGINRIRDGVTEASLTSVLADSSQVDQLLTIQRKIESALLTGDNAIGRQLDSFFAEFTNLSGSPDEPAQRSAVVESARQFSNALRDAIGQLDELKRNVRLQIDNEIDAVNGDLTQLNELSLKIFRFEAQGVERNNELDQRDATLNRIAEAVGSSRNERPGGQLNLMIGNHSIQQGNRPNQFSIEESNGQVRLLLDDSDRELVPETGRLAALIDAHNNLIPAFEEKLNRIAAEVIQSVNSAHSTGIGTAGSFQNLVGNVHLDQATIPLADALPDADLQAGELTVAVTDAAGDRQTFAITIDPSVDSLDDIATRLSSITGIAATIRGTTNQLQIASEPGFEFDFAGGLESNPDLSLVTGTSVPVVSGTFSGAVNEELTVRIEGSGEVGNAASLFANVYSSSGALLSRIDLGDGYEAGSEVELDDGVRLRFDAGTLNDADEFSTQLTGQPDETGLVASLGLNAFFSGSDARTIAVDQRIVDDPNRIATGRSGDASDTSNLPNFIAIDDAELLPGDRTIGEYASDMGSEIGFAISSNSTLSVSLTSYQLKLEQERDSKSGVDLNEELVYLQEYQKSYEAAVRIIQATDDILNELFRMVG